MSNTFFAIFNEFLALLSTSQAHLSKKHDQHICKIADVGIL